jgi:hypothetical protein
LLDSCGRVIGVNSFGTVSQDADSAFYFAVSMREVSRFLLSARVRPQATGAPCRSLAEFARDESDRAAAERARTEEAARHAASAQEKAQREAQMEVIAARENGMALAGVALLLALASGAASFMLLQTDKRREGIVAAALGVLLLVGAAAAWVTRPALSEIDARAEALTSAKRGAARTARARTPLAGDLICVLDLKRSRVTVSDTADIKLRWRADGCADDRTQYANGPDGWFRVIVPGNDETATVAGFDPVTGLYTAERYLLGYDAAAQLRAERDRVAPQRCGAGADAARQMSAGQASLMSLLPQPPNERLVYACGKAVGGRR